MLLQRVLAGRQGKPDVLVRRRDGRIDEVPHLGGLRRVDEVAAFPDLALEAVLDDVLDAEDAVEAFHDPVQRGGLVHVAFQDADPLAGQQMGLGPVGMAGQGRDLEPFRQQVPDRGPALASGGAGDQDVLAGIAFHGSLLALRRPAMDAQAAGFL